MERTVMTAKAYFAKLKGKPKEKRKIPLEDLIEMHCYIKYNLYYGQPKHLIKNALLAQGWNETEIETAFLKVTKPKVFKEKEITNKEPLKERPIETLIPQPRPPQYQQPQTMMQPKIEEVPVPLPPHARK